MSLEEVTSYCLPSKFLADQLHVLLECSVLIHPQVSPYVPFVSFDLLSWMKILGKAACFGVLCSLCKFVSMEKWMMTLESPAEFGMTLKMSGDDFLWGKKAILESSNILWSHRRKRKNKDSTYMIMNMKMINSCFWSTMWWYFSFSSPANTFASEWGAIQFILEKSSFNFVHLQFKCHCQG